MDNVIVLSSSDEDECTASATQKIEADISFPLDDFDNFDLGIDRMSPELNEIYHLPSQTNSISHNSTYRKRLVSTINFAV